MTGHGDKVRSLAVAPDGTIASGDGPAKSGCGTGRDGRGLFARAGQAGDGGGLLELQPGWQALAVGVGRRLGGHDCHVYDIASGKEIVTYTGHDNVVIATAFSPDGRWAATGGGNDNEIHLWDPHSGKPRPGPDGKPLRLAGQGQPVWAAGFSADGRRIGWGNTWTAITSTLPNRHVRCEQALTLPLGEGALGAPVALAEAEAGAFRRAQASFGGFSLSHRKGGDYGGDAILDISKDGRAVASIDRDATDGYSTAPIVSRPMAKPSSRAAAVAGSPPMTARATSSAISWAMRAMSGPSRPRPMAASSSRARTTRRCGCGTSRRASCSSPYSAGADGEWVMWTPQGYYASSPAAPAHRLADQPRPGARGGVCHRRPAPHNI